MTRIQKFPQTGSERPFPPERPALRPYSPRALRPLPPAPTSLSSSPPPNPPQLAATLQVTPPPPPRPSSPCPAPLFRSCAGAAASSGVARRRSRHWVACVVSQAVFWQVRPGADAEEVTTILVFPPSELCRFCAGQVIRESLRKCYLCKIL